MRTRTRKKIIRVSLWVAGPVLVVLAAAAWLVLRASKVDEKAPLAGIPIYVQEYHIWWNNPFAGEENQRVWAKWNDLSPVSIERSIGPSWRRHTGGGAAPLIGCYNPANPEVIRWQLRCAKAAGITALQVNLFPNQGNGEWFGREKVFAEIVRIAGEERMPVFLHDEVQFRKPPATRGVVMAGRLITLLSRYGSLPGYYKIDRAPVVSFQYWSTFAAAADLEEMAATVDRVVHGVHFIVNGRYDPVFDYAPSMKSFVASSTAFQVHPGSNRDTALSAFELEKRLWKIKLLRLQRAFFMRPGDSQFGLWAYPGFEDTKLESAADPAWLPRGENLANMRRTLTRYAAERPDFVLLSSWNDWQENTALEPALDVDGFNGDPYQALRAIAELQGKTFTPPPLPPPEAMDPWLSAHHGGRDLTPPRLSELRVTRNEVQWTLVDETSPVGKFRFDAAPAHSVPIPATPLHGRNAVDLASDFSTPLPAEISRENDRLWLAVTAWDGARGTLAIGYPRSGAPKIDSTDETPLPAEVYFRMRGEQRWRTMLFPLEGFEPGASNNQLVFHYCDKSALAGASLFRESDLVTNGISEISASPERTAVSAKAALGPAAHVLIGGEDVNGNKMEPFAIDPALPASAVDR